MRKNSPFIQQLSEQQTSNSKGSAATREAKGCGRVENQNKEGNTAW